MLALLIEKTILMILYGPLSSQRLCRRVQSHTAPERTRTLPPFIWYLDIFFSFPRLSVTKIWVEFCVLGYTAIIRQVVFEAIHSMAMF